MKRVLVTGATGFVGRILLPLLLGNGWHVRAAVRSVDERARRILEPGGATELVAVGDISGSTAWQAALTGVDAVVHLAARVHVMRDRAADPLAAFRAVNRDGTRALARAAVEAGVGRLVFVSSIKAVGEGGPTCLGEATPPHPDSPYGLSKLEGEAAVAAEAAKGAMTWCVLRPPLVYGPGVGGNFLSLLRWCQRGVPLPLGAVVNRRSLIYVGNLAHAIVLALTHPAAAGRCFFVHDGVPLSTPELIRGLAARLDRPARLVPVSPVVLAAGARLLGAGAVWERVGGSLVVDDMPLRRECGWVPPVTTAQGLDATAAWFRAQRAGALSPDCPKDRRCLAPGDGAQARPLLIYLVTEDYYFWSHRLPMARAAQAAGFRVAVATRVREHGARIAAAGFQVFPLKWQRRHNRPWTVLRDILEIAALYRRERPALVHHVAMKPTLFGGIAARLAGVPAVINALNGLGTVFLSASPLLAPARHALAWVLRRPGSRLLVQNRDDAGFLTAHGFVTPDQVTVIRGSGIDTARFVPLPEPVLSPLTAAFVGRMLEDKGVVTLMEAHRQLRARGVPLRLLLVGTPDSDNPTSLPESTLHAWAQEPGVEWRGQVDDVRTVWAEAHIAVLPSRREGLPKSLLEAAACGRALIATDVPGCREIARAGENALLVPRDDAAALAAALATLATDSFLRTRFATASRALVLSDLAADAVGAQVQTLYRDVLEKA